MTTLTFFSGILKDNMGICRETQAELESQGICFNLKMTLFQ
jgi:hypothetical protein